MPELDVANGRNENQSENDEPTIRDSNPGTSEHTPNNDQYIDLSNSSLDSIKLDEEKKIKKTKRTKEEYLNELAEKRKLKEEEKEKNRLEKDIIKKQKDEERKIKKEEEQQKKEEERLKREEERKTKKQDDILKKEQDRIRREEEKKSKKELEMKQKIRQEKEKEENLSKLRISNFFKKKTEVNDNESKLQNKLVDPLGSLGRPISLLSSGDTISGEQDNSFYKEANNSFTAEQTQFDKKFQSFYLKNNYELYQLKTAPRICDIDHIIFNQSILQNNENFGKEISDTFNWVKSCKKKHIDQRVPYTPQDNSLVVFHECDRGDKTDEELNALLSKIPQKYLKFYENVRSPFTGTYSDTTVLPSNDPFEMKMTDFEYDKDSDDENYNFSDSELNEENDFEDDEEGEELDSEDDEDDEDEDFDDANELSGFVEVDTATGSAKENNKRSKKTLLIPTIQYRPNEAQVILDPVTLSLFNQDDRDYMDSISIKMLYPTPINVTEPIGLPAETPEPKKRSYDQINNPLTEEVVLDKQQENETDNSNEPESKKVKVIISDAKSLIQILSQVQGCPYSKNTLVEVLGFALDNKFTRKVIKDTVDHYASRDKDKWSLKDSEIIAELKKNIGEDAAADKSLTKPILTYWGSSLIQESSPDGV